MLMPLLLVGGTLGCLLGAVLLLALELLWTSKNPNMKERAR